MRTGDLPKSRCVLERAVKRRALWAALAVFLVTSCTSSPRFRPQPHEPAPDPGNRQDIVQYAKSFIGTPYRNGGTTRNGVDCSGLVMTVFNRFDIRLPRTSLGQSRVGEHVARANIEPGDLVFFKTSRRPVSHVGIYIGGGRFIHASTRARSVRVDAMSSDYFSRRYVVARRVLEP